MRQFHYCEHTGRLLGESQADPNPMEPGAWLVARFATLQEPPEAPAGQVAVWTGEAWQLQAEGGA